MIKKWLKGICYLSESAQFSKSRGPFPSSDSQWNRSINGSRNRDKFTRPTLGRKYNFSENLAIAKVFNRVRDELFEAGRLTRARRQLIAADYHRGTLASISRGWSGTRGTWRHYLFPRLQPNSSCNSPIYREQNRSFVILQRTDFSIHVSLVSLVSWFVT